MSTARNMTSIVALLCGGCSSRRHPVHAENSVLLVPKGASQPRRPAAGGRFQGCLGIGARSNLLSIGKASSTGPYPPLEALVPIPGIRGGFTVRPGWTPTAEADLYRMPPGLAELPLAVRELQAKVEVLADQVETLREEIAALRAGDPEQLLTTEQAAKLLGRSVGSTRKAAERGALLTVRVGSGRRLRFRRGDLLAHSRR
jgi:excisionase family DNA binding protein